MAKYAGLNAFISSWWGQGTPTAKRLPLLLDAARAQGFHVAPYYELESSATPPSNTQLSSDFTNLAGLASGDPAWLTVGGKPVLFIYNTGTEASCAAITRLQAANAGRFYLNAKVFAGYGTCATQPQSWHQYGPAVGYDQQGAFSATVSPGFYKFNESSPRLTRDLTRFRSDLARQTASGAQWQLTTTFNEWGEGTSVEPATQWPATSGNGGYLDAMRAAYGGSVALPTNTVTKVITFVEENHSLAAMKAGMPYLYSQATKYGYANNWTAITHPSLPNYLAIAGGSTFGVTDDANPSSHPVSGPSAFGSALTLGKTAKSYQESMTSNCLGTSSGRYVPKHNPWAYFTGERTSCQQFDVPSGTTTSGSLHNDITAGTLPTVAEVTPNLDHDAHDGSLATADTWLKGWLAQVYAGADWRSGHLAVVITADEDDRNSGNKVLTVVIHPSQSQRVVTTALTHYSLTGLMTQLTGAPCLRAGCTAPSLATAFALPMS